MNTFLYEQAVNSIESALLSSPIYRTARRLLDRADETGGYLEISHAEALTLVGSEAWGTVRNHLISLERAGIIRKWLNHSVRVWFLDYPAPAWLTPQPAIASDDDRALGVQTRALGVQTRALGVQEEDQADDDRALGVQTRALGVQTRALGVQTRALGVQHYTHAHAQGWVELSRVDPDLDPDQVIPNPTQPPQPDSEHEWTVGLLTDSEVDMQLPNALRIAELHTPLYVARHVATWWDKRAEESAGVLVYRLLRAIGKSKPRAHFSDAFLASDYWQRQYERARHLPFWAGLPPPKEDQQQANVWQGIVVG